MNIRKYIFGLVLAVFVLALCTSGMVMAGQDLTLTFQEHFNIVTGEQDESYTGTLDISLRKWDPIQGGGGPPAGVGIRGTAQLRQQYNVNDGTQYPAYLVYFPGVVAAINALPDDGDGPNAGVGPYITSAKLIITASAYSLNPAREEGIPNPVWMEASMVTPNAKMWVETDVTYLGKERPRTNGTYRWWGWGTAAVPWSTTHVYALRDGDPNTYTPPGDQQANAGDRGPYVDAYMMDGQPYSGMFYAELDVTSIINDEWLQGTANQGFNIGMGVNEWDGDYWLYTQITTTEGADGSYTGGTAPPAGTVITDAPKLVITYSYNGNITADAGDDMGDYYADAVTRVKPGVEITLDASLSDPVFAGAPLSQFKWTWNHGGAEYSVTSPNDQTTAQFFVDDATADNVTLVASDDIGQTGTDGARIKVTSVVPGDLNGDGCVNLTDFVILRNDF